MRAIGRSIGIPLARVCLRCRLVNAWSEYIAEISAIRCSR